MASHPPPTPDTQGCEVNVLRVDYQTLSGEKQRGVPVGAGREANSSFLIPHSSFTTRQSKASAWRQAL